MKNITFIIVAVLCLSSFVSYSQNEKNNDKNGQEIASQKNKPNKSKPHRYGSYYCPDNLIGFPPIDLMNWKTVPFINGRMATKEETQNSTSLIFVDNLKYPNAKVLDIPMPKLARYYNGYSKRKDLIIVIQAINVDNDSIVGFRYLNGGNGSARLKDVKFLSDSEIELISQSRFVTHNIKINATQDVVWEVLTRSKNADSLQSTFDIDNTLKTAWRKISNVNYYYPNTGMLTSSYANKLFGNYYIQNDYDFDGFQYTQKFLLSENEQTNNTELKIACGPFGEDFETQKNILNNWAQKVKDLSENK